MKSIFLTFFTLCLATSGFGQELTQTVRGTVRDLQTSSPLAGATVVLLDSDPVKGAYTNEAGEFRIDGVPIGRASLKVSYLGYLEIVIPQVQINTGKETVLEVMLEESVTAMEEVVISAGKEKDKALNEMTTVSSRTFDLEETSRYAGSRGDPARMAANFAGVSGANDSRNDIIIRGNSPAGLLWRLEGINIPNPNHYGAAGATGGPVSMLNNNVLSRSDFMTAAFPAQYGNAVAGVFDLNMRHGNDEQHEFLGQIGFNGFEIGAEGPLSSTSKASYLVNYRYSTLGVFDALGVDFGTGAAVPEYQDISFKIDIPTENTGRFSVFGLGGISNIDLLGSEADTTSTDLFGDENEDIRPRYRTGIVGISHKLLLNEKTSQTITLAASHAWESVTVDSLSQIDRTPIFQNGITNQTNKYSLIYQLNKKFNAKNNIRIGAYLDLYDFQYRDSVLAENGEDFIQLKNSSGTTLLSQAYAQWQHRFSDRLTLNTGINLMHLSLNNSLAVEPRLGLRYQLNQGQSVNVGYGYHSQIQPMPVYFLETLEPGGGIRLGNEELGFSQSQHLVLGYDRTFGADLRMKVEGYFQYLTNVPVDPFSSSFSLINTGADFGLPDNTNLVNEGTGRNYGVELTLEKFFSRNYYFLLTGSLFDSQYRGSDEVWRNTAFNGRYVVNALAGKEFSFGNGKKNTIAIDWKLTLAGGRYVTPIDLVASQEQGREVLVSNLAYSEQFDDYFRTDIKLTYRRNGKKVTQEFSLDAQNVTNRDNIFSRSYNRRTGSLSIENQLGLFIIPQYRILF